LLKTDASGDSPFSPIEIGELAALALLVPNRDFRVFRDKFQVSE